MSRAFHAPGMLQMDHLEYNCQCPEHADPEATVALRPVVNPVIAEWRTDFFRGWREAAADIMSDGRPNPVRMVGGAYSALMQGYRAAVAAAGGRR